MEKDVFSTEEEKTCWEEEEEVFMHEEQGGLANMPTNCTANWANNLATNKSIHQLTL